MKKKFGWLVVIMGIVPALASAEGRMKLPEKHENVCDTVAALAKDWVEQHQAGSTVEEISKATLETVTNAGIEPESNSGMVLLTASDFALISVAQQDPQTADEAQVIAFNTCGKWIKGRGRVQYKIEDRPLVWE